LDYSDILEYLYSKLPMFQRIGPAAYKDNLDNTIQLCDYYDNPHKKIKTIHVGGTNGKGSVSHMIAAILQSAGYKTGLYTSPHLIDFRERIRINGEMISTDEVVEWVEDYREKNDEWNIEPSFFELTVVMAFDFFARHEVDVAIIEVGLGGRLDSTNIITPEISVITNIGLDHTTLLGDTIEKIAYEKAGIIKDGIPVVIGTRQEDTVSVFAEAAALKLAPLFYADQEFAVSYAMADLEGNQMLTVSRNDRLLYPQLKLDLKGMYQQKNVPAVLKTMELLQQMGWEISEENIITGFAHAKKLTGLQGRWQILGYNPLLVCDVAHNTDGIAEVIRQIEQTPHKDLHMVLGFVNDKDISGILNLLPTDATYYFASADIPRALDERELARYAAEFGLQGSAYSSVEKAFDTAVNRAERNDLVFIGGSTFVVAEIL
jgi:dihydrofolate synthase / folylpolyglutamate synthase